MENLHYHVVIADTFADGSGDIAAVEYPIKRVEAAIQLADAELAYRRAAYQAIFDEHPGHPHIDTMNRNLDGPSVVYETTQHYPDAGAKSVVSVIACDGETFPVGQKVAGLNVVRESDLSFPLPSPTVLH